MTFGVCPMRTAVLPVAERHGGVAVGDAKRGHGECGHRPCRVVDALDQRIDGERADRFRSGGEVADGDFQRARGIVVHNPDECEVLAWCEVVQFGESHDQIRGSWIADDDGQTVIDVAEQFVSNPLYALPSAHGRRDDPSRNALPLGFGERTFKIPYEVGRIVSGRVRYFADECKMVMPAANEIGDDRHGRLGVVEVDGVESLGVRGQTEQHRWQAGARGDGDARIVLDDVHDDEAIAYGSAVEPLDVATAFDHGAEDDVVVVPARFPGDGGQIRGDTHAIVLCADVLDQTDELRFGGAQRTRAGVGVVVQLFHRRLNALQGFLGDGSRAGERIGDGALSHSGQCCHILAGGAAHWGAPRRGCIVRVHGHLHVWALRRHMRCDDFAVRTDAFIQVYRYVSIMAIRARRVHSGRVRSGR